MAISPMQKVSSLVSSHLGDTLTNIQNWGNVFVNVHSFGAKGDGRTDDTSAIQNAIESTRSTGGIVYFKPGTYIVTGVRLHSNVRLVGSGMNITTLKLKSASNTNVITTETGSSFISLERMSIDGNKANQTSSGNAVNITGCTIFRVEICEIKNTLGHGINIDQSSYIEIRESNIYNNFANGIIFRDSSHLEITSNNIFQNQQRGIGCYGETQYGSQYVTISENEISQNTLDGIRLDYSSASTVVARYVTIENNIVRNNVSHGITVRASESVISVNQVISNGTTSSEQGIVVQSTGTVIDGNIVMYGSGVGIDLGNCASCVVSNNLVMYNGLVGIEVNSTVHTVVNANTVMYNNNVNYSSSLAAGILIHVGSPFTVVSDGYSQNITVTGNRVENGSNQRYGIYATADAKYVEIVSNICKGSGSVADIFCQTALVNVDGNTTGATPPDVISVSSTFNMIFPISISLVKITGNTTINSIAIDSGVYPFGKQIRIIFSGTLVVNNKATASGNITLQGSTNLTTNVNTTLDLVCDGTGWIETGRSVK